MTDNQENILKELLEKYFNGGNATAENGIILKDLLEAIRDFVKENFSE